MASLRLAVVLLLIAIAPVAGAKPSAFFGTPGEPHFDAYPLDEDLPANLASGPHGAGEPTIGIPWNTDHVFFQAFSNTYRAVFDDREFVDGKPKVEWTDATPLTTPINVDPMIHADYLTGRIYAGGLAGPCSLMAISDDDGHTWKPAANMCSGPQFDHQSIGSGPWAPSAPDSAVRNLVYPRATYYCAQLQLTACATSLDGGYLWLPFTEVLGGCGGLHGHISVSEATGFAAVPHGSCAGPESPTAVTGGPYVGFAFTDNNGLTWNSRVMPDSEDGVGFDPDLVFSQESGWMWVSQADEEGVHIALSKDEGQTWETLGTGMAGFEPATWFNLTGTFHDPVTGHPLVFGAFPDLEAGDDLRAALAFLGTTNPKGKEPFTDCSDKSDDNIWHYYLSQTFDGGQTWTTTRLWEDPVQVGAIWNGGGGDPCRNLLDFNDMDMDSNGRLHIAFADGCTDECSDKYAAWVAGTGDAPTGEDSRDAWGTVLRQTTGRSLFASEDFPVSDATTTVTNQPDEDEEAPAPGALLLLVALAASVAVLRRR